MDTKPWIASERHNSVMHRCLLAIIVPVALTGCVGSPASATQATAPAACLTVAQDDHGTVSAAFTSTVGAIRKLSSVANNPQLDGYSSDQAATVCYVDGEIPKGPPPLPSGTIPPSFDRAVIIVVGQDTIFVAAGYRQSLPIQAP